MGLRRIAATRNLGDSGKATRKSSAKGLALPSEPRRKGVTPEREKRAAVVYRVASRMGGESEVRALALAAFVAMVGCAAPAAGPAPASPNVVLVVIDTLRADALGGETGGPETPHLDEIAREGLRFTQVVAQAPWTVPSVSTLLTGRYPFEHGQGAHSGKPPEYVPTVTEGLAGVGYATAAFVEVDWPLMRQGFQTFEIPMGSTEQRYARAESREPSPTFQRAIEWLRASPRRPFFLMIHSFEVHDYYLGRPRHREYALARHPSYRGPFRRWRPRPTEDETVGRMIDDLLAADEEDTAFVRSLYDGAVQVADEEVGRLDDALRELGLQRDTVLVVTSDHGEGFAPALRRVSHGGRLHEDLLHVPLVIRWPGRIPVGVTNERVESLDIAPTLLRLAGADTPGPQREASMRGRPLVERSSRSGGESFVPAPLERELAFSEESAFTVLPTGQRARSTAHQVALQAGHHKLLRSGDGDRLFDLARDPLETTDRLAAEPQVASRMGSELDRILRDLKSPPRGPRDDIKDALRSLGYAR